MSSMILSPHSLSPSSALSAETWMTGMSSPGKSYFESSSRTSSSTSSSNSGSSTMSALLRATTIAGTSTWRASRVGSGRRRIALAGEQDVLARLRHGAVGRRDHEDRAVHLRGARDHVLDVVGVTRAVDVRVVALLGLVLDVRGRDRDAALTLLRRLVDLVERLGVRVHG